MKARIFLVGVALLAGIGAHAAGPGAVTASGTVSVYHDLCDSVSKGDVALALLAADDAQPTQSWTVLVRAQNQDGCSAYAAGVCAGSGSLAEGVTLKDCTGPVEGGSFGPVVVCYPGPASQTVHSVAHVVPVVVDGNYGTFEGRLDADLYGTAVDEPQNLCV